MLQRSRARLQKVLSKAMGGGEGGAPLILVVRFVHREITQCQENYQRLAKGVNYASIGCLPY